MSLRFYYFNSTHWDREWYLPFEQFRRHLVAAADGILSAIEDGRVDKFTFDGQTVVLEDCLEICPEWRERFAAAVSDGRLNVGPWYVMSDEFLASGESLIHNLLIGRDIARSFGHEPWRIGYLCDTFGHCAQMPQILAGFGIKAAVVCRGLADEAPPRFLWRAPDGTAVPAIRLEPGTGYAGFSTGVTGLRDDTFADEKTFRERLRKLVDEKLRPFYGDAVILSDACDHIDCHTHIGEFFRWIRDEYPGCGIIHTDYLEYLDEFPPDPPEIAGELISTCRGTMNFMIPHTLSSRYDVKYANDRCQNILELGVGPAMAALVAAGDRRMMPFWKYAWKHFLQNHAHDSICGCSVDAVHRQMLARFEAVEQVCETIADELDFADRKAVSGLSVYDVSWDGIKNDCSTLAAKDGRYFIRVWNPLPWDREETVVLELEIPCACEYPKSWGEPFGGYERMPAFALYDERGEEIRYAVGHIRTRRLRRVYRADTRSYDILPVTCTLRLRACGWTNLRMEPVGTPMRDFGTLMTAPLCAENAFVRLSVSADGRFTVRDLRSDRDYGPFNDLIIDREIGDGWNHVQPRGGKNYFTPAQAAEISVESDSSAGTVFVITRRIEVPRELEYRSSGIEESSVRNTLEWTARVTLSASSPRVDVKISLRNNLKDVRARLVVPTGIPGKYFAYQNFCFTEREAARASGRETERWNESEPPEKNFSGIVGKRDGRGGLAFISACGMHEVSASAFESGELLVTLFRAHLLTVCTNGEKDCELQKELEFDCALLPFTAGTDGNGLFRAMQEFRAGIRTRMFPAAEPPRDASLFRVTGDGVVTALEPVWNTAGREVAMRLCNFADRPGRVNIAVGRPCAVRTAGLDMESRETVAERTDSFDCEVPPAGIVTLIFDFGGEG